MKKKRSVQSLVSLFFAYIGSLIICPGLNIIYIQITSCFATGIGINHRPFPELLVADTNKHEKLPQNNTEVQLYYLMRLYAVVLYLKFPSRLTRLATLQVAISDHNDISFRVVC